MPTSTALPSRWVEALAGATLALGLLVSAHNLQALAHAHVAAMRCSASPPGPVCKLLCWIGG